MELKIDIIDKNEECLTYNKIYNATIISTNNGLQLPYCPKGKCRNSWVKRWIIAGYPLLWNNFSCSGRLCLSKKVNDNGNGNYKYNIEYTACGDLISVQIIKSEPRIYYYQEPKQNSKYKLIIDNKFTWSTEDIASSAK